MTRLTKALAQNITHHKKSLMVYINAGDPDLTSTYLQIEAAIENGADIIELGVPFANSFTDGATVRSSHERALQNGVTFEDVCHLAYDIHQNFDTPIVLLVDFSHSVKPRGLEYIAAQASANGVDALLVHGLPPLFANQFVNNCRQYDLAPIFSIYPNSTEKKISEITTIAKGFLYLVSHYGKTGSSNGICFEEVSKFATRISQYTELPLLLGFGVQTPRDVAGVLRCDAIDGVVVGSAISRIVESQNEARGMLHDQIGQAVKKLAAPCHSHQPEHA